MVAGARGMKGERPLFDERELVSEETKKRWNERIAFLLDHSDDLTEWESTFIQDIEKRLADGKYLTLAQSSKLNQIFHKVEEAIG
jgi:hypothetical protein